MKLLQWTYNNQSLSHNDSYHLLWKQKRVEQLPPRDKYYLYAWFQLKMKVSLVRFCRTIYNMM
jgi:hypothetical protein